MGWVGGVGLCSFGARDCFFGIYLFKSFCLCFLGNRVDVFAFFLGLEFLGCG